jgi:hypothetical protein
MEQLPQSPPKDRPSTGTEALPRAGLQLIQAVHQESGDWQLIVYFVAGERMCPVCSMTHIIPNGETLRKVSVDTYRPYEFLYCAKEHCHERRVRHKGRTWVERPDTG